MVSYGVGDFSIFVGRTYAANGKAFLVLFGWDDVLRRC